MVREAALFCEKTSSLILIHADGSRGGRVLPPFASLFFQHDISKTCTARITKRDI